MIDVPAFRAALTTEPLRPYDVIFDVDRWVETTAGEVDAIMNQGWVFRSLPPVSLAPPIAWDDICRENRSQHLFFHSWAFLGPILAHYDRTRESRYLDFAARIALDWVRQFPSLETTSPFAWYDYAVGTRAFRLAYILDAAAREARFNDVMFEHLLASVPIHAGLLANDAKFPGHSNHGVYVAATQRAMARRLPTLPGMNAAAEQALNRLHSMLHGQFTDEGMHREHSPEYHWITWEAFNRLIRFGFLGGAEVEALNDRIQEALAWLVLPNGSLAMFGDSGQRIVVPNDDQLATNPSLRFVVTGGREGRVPSETVRGFPTAGYFVARNRWPSGPSDAGDCSYLAQTSAFHSRVHKHADDLSFVWFDHGHELLVDPGRYGYLGKTEPGSTLRKQGFWYSDPNRMYVESTRAHNTVEIDDLSHERVDVAPYGSALRRWGESAGIKYAESQVLHRHSIRHTRLLLFKPGAWLIVYDHLVDIAGAPHCFSQRFHFAPELDVQALGDRFEITIPGLDLRLYMSSIPSVRGISPVRGQQEPELLGWIARQDYQMTPCWTAAYVAEQTPCQTFATLFAFGSDSPVIPSTTTECPEPGAAIRLTWSQDGVVHSLAAEQDGTDGLAVIYQTRPLRTERIIGDEIDHEV